jgi:predicted amidophosphoribosyltransferase
LNEEGSCPNYVCGWPTRCFDKNYAIAVRSGDIEQAINAYKYKSLKGWAQIFGRVLVGYLDNSADAFTHFDLIIATPTYTSDCGNSRTWDHIQLVLNRAHEVAEARWPFYVSDSPVIVKLCATTPLVGNGWKKRREIAEGELRNSLSVPSPNLVAGKNILVFDDVFTDGFTLREVARSLIVDGGAIAVSGITLVRQPLRART